MTRLMLLDTASLYFRAFYGVPETITAPDGTPVNAVRGLLDFIARLVTDRQPQRLVACLDADWRPAFRVDLISEYKEHRVAKPGTNIETVPFALEAQVPIILDVLTALGVAHIGVAGFEADDVIGTLATADSGPVDVVTGDRDLFQLVNDERGVRILYTARGVGKHEIIDEAAVAKKYGIGGQAYADFATLRGDPSDGLPGVPGVGDKTAATLVNRFGDMAGVIAAADDDSSDLSPTLRHKILGAKDYLERAVKVVAVRHDVPLPEYDDQIPRQPADPERLVALGAQWGLDSALNRVLTAFASEPSIR